jgi:hypothetical protein
MASWNLARAQRVSEGLPAPTPGGRWGLPVVPRSWAQPCLVIVGCCCCLLATPSAFDWMPVAQPIDSIDVLNDPAHLSTNFPQARMSIERSLSRYRARSAPKCAELTLRLGAHYTFVLARLAQLHVSPSIGEGSHFACISTGLHTFHSDFPDPPVSPCLLGGGLVCLGLGLSLSLSVDRQTDTPRDTPLPEIGAHLAQARAAKGEPRSSKERGDRARMA